MNRVKPVLLLLLSVALLCAGLFGSGRAPALAADTVPSDTTPAGAVAEAPAATPEADTPVIIGGQEAAPGAWPWMAALVTANQPSDYEGQFCGGALIAPQWVLTAVHCVEGQTPSSIDVTLGKHKLTDSGGERIHVIQIIQHPNYNNNTLDSDVALLKLQTASSRQTVGLIPQGDTTLSAVGKLATITGWGNMSTTGNDYADALMQVSVPIVSNATCNAPSSYGGQITSNMMCAGYPQGGKDSCQGDSGGPLVVPDSAGSGWLQAGVVSWGIGCAQPNYYGVYARVSNFTNWINSKIGSQATNTPTSTPTRTATATATATSTPTATAINNSTATSTPTVTPTAIATPSPTLLAPPAIVDVRVSNVRDTSFSVSWLSEDETIGEIVLVPGPSGVRSSGVTRVASTTGTAHYVIFDSLEKETTYYFYVQSGSAVDDNQGDYYSVTTGATLAPLPDSDNIYGDITQETRAGVDGCIVYVQTLLSGAGGSVGTSALLAVLTDSNGAWGLNLGNVRTQSLDAYYGYSLTGATLGVEVQCSPVRQGYADILTSDAHGSPAADIRVRSLSRSLLSLGSGWNFVALPHKPLTGYNASRVCSDLTRSNAGAPIEVLRWESGGWNGYVCGVDANDFALDVAGGYFVRNQAPNSWALAGDPVPAAPPSVVNGWNAVSSQGSANALALCAEITSPWLGQEINRWFAGGWDGHICGRPFNDFPTENGRGYFVKAAGGPSAVARVVPLLAQTDSQTNSVQDVRVTNLRDTSVVISWQTTEPGNGLVEVLLNNASIALAEDVRGTGTIGRLHYVSVSNLTPATTYQFTVQSVGEDSRISRGQGSFATSPTLSSVPSPNSAYGRVMELDGATPVANALVALIVQDGDGRNSPESSLPLSSITDGNGYWYVNLGNARQNDGSSFGFTAGTDGVQIQVFRPGILPAEAALGIDATFPAADILSGWRAVYLPALMR